MCVVEEIKVYLFEYVSFYYLMFGFWKDTLHEANMIKRRK